MTAAGMTRGAFYARFASKRRLYQEAILYAAAESHAREIKASGGDNGNWLDGLISRYLSVDHINRANAPGCLLAFLATDTAVREPDIRKTYTRLFKNLNAVVRRHAKSGAN